MLLNKIRNQRAGALGLLMVAAAVAHAGALAPQQKAPADSRMPAAEAQRLLATRSAHFIENKGQWDPRARFAARSENLDLWFTDRGIRYDNHVSTGGQNGRFRSHAVSMTFVGGNAVRPVPSKKARTRIDFVHGKSHQTGVATYGELYAKGIYPGIDVRAYFDDAKPRYDVVVAPGSDAKKFKLAFDGDQGLSIEKGALRIGTSVGGFENGKPVAYQTIGGKRVSVVADWKIVGKHEATFALGTYDHTKPLVIDPLVYGSYFGGNGGADEIRTVVTDGTGGVFLAGATYSFLFPVNSGPYGLNIHGGSDALIARLQGDAYNFDYAAYIGGSSDDVAQFLKRDGDGNVWMAGTTKSVDFPGNNRDYRQILATTAQLNPNFPTLGVPTGGTFRIGYGNPATTGVYSAAIPYNATTAQVQAALRAAPLNFTTATVTAIPRVINNQVQTRLPLGRYQIDLPASQPIPLSIDNLYRSSAGAVINDGLPPSYHLVSPAPAVNPGGNNTDALGITPGGRDAAYSNNQSFRLFGSVPFGGTFNIQFRNTPAAGTAPTTATTTPLAFNASNQNIADALNALANKGTVVFGANGGPIPTGAGGTRPNVNVPMVDATNPGNVQKALVFDNTNLVPNVSYAINPESGTNFSEQSDIFVMRFARSNTAILDPTTNQAVLIFGSAGTDRFASFDIRPGSGASATTPVEFILAGSTKSQLLNYPLIAYPGSGTEYTGFLARYTWTLPAAPNGVSDQGFSQVASTPNTINTVDPSNDLPYVRSQDQLQVDVRGAVLDADGNAYVDGTLYAVGNTDTTKRSTTFYTGNSVAPTLFAIEGQEYGNRVRNYDIFVRKYRRDGVPFFSGVIGGTNFDEAGGIGLSLDGTYVNTGSAIAIDAARNVYVTGTSGSFDFVRTRGGYNEVFTDAPNVIVTKISADGQNILYSTNLRMASNPVPTVDLIGDEPPLIAAIMPAGIAVDSRGFAFVSTNLRPNTIPFPGGPTPTVPNQPTGSTLSAIPLVGAIDGLYESPTGTEFPTIEGGLTTLNATGTDLVFSTYLGGRLDDFVYAPYVDVNGDVWSVGWTDSRREYNPGLPAPYITVSQLPDSLITPRAFKSTPDYQDVTSFSASVLYGLLNTNPQANSLDQYGRVKPNYIAMNYSRDGFIDKFRVGLASVSDLTLTPLSIPGGLGNFVRGFVTLDQGAPSGGGQITITLPEGTAVATLSATQVAGAQNTSVSTLNIPIAAGARTAEFFVYTKGVVAPTSVSVRADFSGSFIQRAFQVQPFLQKITLATNATIGGDPNGISGIVTLNGNAPADTDIAVTISDPTLATVATVPVRVLAGQDTASFNITTVGVDKPATVQVTASIPSIAGPSFSVPLEIDPATIQSIAVNPTIVSGGATSAITVTLNGKAGPSGFVATLAVTPANSGATLSTPTITIAPQTLTGTATVTAPFVDASTVLTVSASNAGANTATVVRGRSDASATLTVSPAVIASLTLNPTSVAAGGTSTGTVTLATAAPSTGTAVFLKVPSGSFARFVDPTTGAPAESLTLQVAAGSTTGTFTLRALYPTTNATVNVISGPTAASIATTPPASSAKTATLTVLATTFTLALDKGATVGGGVVTGTITLPSPATSEVKVTVYTNSTVAPIVGQTSQVVGTTTRQAYVVTIPVGSTTGTFTINTTGVAVATPVTVSATAGTGSQATGPVVSQTLTVNPVGILSVTATPSTVRGLGYVTLIVRFDAPTPNIPNDKLTVNFSLNSVVTTKESTGYNLRSITVLPGYTSYKLVYRVNRVSRNQLVTATVTYHGTQGATTFTVLR